MEMIETPKPVIFDCLVDQKENCFPMIPSGKAHNEMILAALEDDAGVELENIIDEKGKMLVRLSSRSVEESGIRAFAMFSLQEIRRAHEVVLQALRPDAGAELAAPR